MSDPRRTCTIEEAAKILGVGRQTLYDHLGIDSIDLVSDELRIIRIGRRVLVPLDELDRVLAAQASA